MIGKLRRLLAPPPIAAPPTAEIRTVTLAGQLVSYKLKRTRRRSIGLRIDDRGLVVNIPMRTTEKWLSSVLQDKALWVVDKLAQWQIKHHAPPTLQDGHVLHFMGETLTLRLVSSLFDTFPQRRAAELFVHVTGTSSTNAHTSAESAINNWYKLMAGQHFNDRVALYAPLMRVSPSLIKLTSARAQWGSCTTQGTLRFNWQLIKMPQRLIDYVVIHELAHLIEMNHSQAFWREVEKLCPDYLMRRKELRLYQATLR